MASSSSDPLPGHRDDSFGFPEPVDTGAGVGIGHGKAPVVAGVPLEATGEPPIMGQIEEDALIAFRLQREFEREAEREATDRERDAKRARVEGDPFVGHAPAGLGAEEEPRAEHRAFSAVNGKWHEMQRVVAGEEQLMKTMPGHLRNRASLASWIVHAMLGQRHPDATAPAASAPWQLAPHGSKDEPPSPVPVALWDLLGFVMSAQDTRLVGVVWRNILERRRAAAADADAHQLAQLPASLVTSIYRTQRVFLSAVEFLALRARRPRLLLEFLSSPHVPLGFGYGDCAGELVSIAVAILDCVFVPDRSIDVHEARAVFQSRHMTDPQLGRTDSALYGEGWKRVITALVGRAGDRMPNRLHELSSKTRRASTSLLALAVRYVEYDDFFLDEMLKLSKWPASSITEAFREALRPDTGVRGEALPMVLGKLYRVLLDAWRTNPAQMRRGAAGDHDELAVPWRHVASASSGYEKADLGGKTSMSIAVSTGPMANAMDEQCQRHPDEWKSFLASMIDAHAPAESDPDSHLWDHGSPLFASLLRQSFRSVVGEKSKTQLLTYLLYVSMTTSKMNPRLMPWLQQPQLVYKVATYHTVALKSVIDCMSVDENGTPLGWPAAAFCDQMQDALVRCMAATKKEPARLLINALGARLPRTISGDRYGLDNSHASMGFLAFFVLRFGKGVDEDERNDFGDDYAEFLNSRLERDFRKVLDAVAWTNIDLEEALGVAAANSRSICAKMLMSAPFWLPPGDDGYLRAISSWLLEPGREGALAVQSHFETLADGQQPPAA